MATTPSPQKRRPRWLGFVVLGGVLLIVAAGAIGWYILSNRLQWSGGLFGPVLQSSQGMASQTAQGGMSAGEFMQKLADNHIDDAYAAATTAFRAAVTREHFDKYVHEQPAFHQRPPHFDFIILGGAATVTFTPVPGQTPDDKVYVTLVPEGGELKVSRLQVNGQSLP